MGELNHILQRLEALLGPLGGEPAALDGGITNRNYRVSLGEHDYVVRLPGKDTELLGIDRSAELLANTAAAELGIAPRVAASLEDCLVTEFVACNPIDSSVVADGVAEIALALRAFHRSAVSLPTRFWVPELLEDYATIVHRRGGKLPAAYAATVRIASRIGAALALRSARPCHNDLLPGNIIRARDSGGLMLVDWEYAGMGDPRFDLGNLAVNNELDDSAEERLLAAYYGTAPSDAQRAALKLMRVLSDAREAAWGVLQAHVSAIGFDFERYGAEHFERLLDTVERHGFEELIVIVSHAEREDPSSAQTA